MRLTVGPLPAAVYWRRRAVVVGAILLFLIVMMYSCANPGESGVTPQASASAEPESRVYRLRAGSGSRCINRKSV